MSKFYPLTVDQVKNETRDTIAVRFAVPDGLRETFRYAHGQHVTLRAAINGEEVSRSYSICSAVQDRELRVAIKRSPGGLFSTWANDTLKPGQTIDVMPPAGRFSTALSPENSKRYLGFAAGSGITPLLSIVKTTLVAEPRSEFALVYANRSSSTVIFKDELSDLKDIYPARLNLVYIMSREQLNVDLFQGRITRDKCDRLLQQWIEVSDFDVAFVCGPEEMMQVVAESLQTHGMPKDNIRVERFAASIPKRARLTHAAPSAGAQACEVTLVIDGSERRFSMDKDTESVLDAGLKQGIEIRHSCKGGVCATCRAKLIEGKVDMDVNFALEDYEIARGFVLTCQSFPVTDRIVLDFDRDT